MKAIINCLNLETMPAVARQIIDFGKNHTVWLLEGQMGAGKTTLTKAICKELGVVAVVQSPTFSIVNEYQTTTGEVIYHFDCYRLRNITEALDIGIDEYLDSGNLCLIEWSSKITELLPSNCLKISIEVLDNQSRQIEISK